MQDDELVSNRLGARTFALNLGQLPGCPTHWDLNEIPVIVAGFSILSPQLDIWQRSPQRSRRRCQCGAGLAWIFATAGSRRSRLFGAPSAPVTVMSGMRSFATRPPPRHGRSLNTTRTESALVDILVITRASSFSRKRIHSIRRTQAGGRRRPLPDGSGREARPHRSSSSRRIDGSRRCAG